MRLRKVNRFLTGPWNAFMLVDFDKEYPVTPAQVSRNMRVFEKKYGVTKEVFAEGDLICLHLMLEEKRRRSARLQARSPAQEETVIITKYKLALSPEDGLLFCHRSIPQKIIRTFGHALHASDIVALELHGSSPDALLLMHRQAARQSLQLCEYDGVLNKRRRLGLEHPEPAGSDVLKQLGSHFDAVPGIRHLSADLSNVPVTHDSANSLYGMRISNLQMEMQSLSVFDFYINGAVEGLFKTVPKWVVACRSSGKTRRKVVFTE